MFHRITQNFIFYPIHRKVHTVDSVQHTISDARPRPVKEQLIRLTSNNPPRTHLPESDHDLRFSMNVASTFFCAADVSNIAP